MPFDAADRIEIGYWLRADATGQGYATEAARAAVEVALSLPGISRLTIHCDERNAPSAAVPSRLGFHLASTIVAPGVAAAERACRLQVWDWARSAD